MLLEHCDPFPVLKGGPDQGRGVVLSCEHAGLAIPRALAGLGLSAVDLHDHIGWDPGALLVTQALSRALDVPYVAQRYSRLVIDCNRPRTAPDLAPIVADTRTVPGNIGLSDQDLTARWEEIHQPFHKTLAALIRGSKALVSVHSFTRRRKGDAGPRNVQIGVLARDGNPLFSHLVQRLPDLFDGPVVANEPYEIEDASDYTIPVHAEAQGLPHALIEIRNDLIADAAGIARIATALETALKEFQQ